MTTHAVCVAAALERSLECPKVRRALRFAEKIAPGEPTPLELHSLACAAIEEQEEKRGEPA